MIQLKKSRVIPLVNKEYHLFNFLIFVAILILVLYLKTGFTIIKCPYAELGIKCKTCGLTTSFRKIINNDLTHLNFGPFLLCMTFLSQLFIRPFISLILLYSSKSKIIRNIDIIFSAALIGYAYIKLILN
ncbi:hypothetical protein EV142_10256 [Flavobacterium circumlabens]|uniref:DUF2752 domain-containing protein n=1 Tax=Flavobacterium circumlabens TaxID=2133765 RepID=A0ABY2B2Z2_9FLAO|nr:hypothetical protein EV142_10256 [Flavobacterium circumlabens]